MKATLSAGLAVLWLPLVSAIAGDAPFFRDVTRQAGVFSPHHKRVFKNPYAHIMQGYTALGASAAVADYDGDGLEDIFVTDSAEDGKNHLYRNRGDFTFADRAEKAGVAGGNDASNAAADALWFDYNNDSKPDLLLVCFGYGRLYENQGDGTFRDVTRRAGLHRYLNAISAIAFDFDLDGDLDLFVGAYFRDVNLFDPDTAQFFPENFETAANGGGVILFRNNGDGTFSDAARQAGIQLSGWTLDLGHADADNDGDDDLYVACDFGSDHFLVNNGDGTFSDRTSTATGLDTKKGMNVDWGDFDNDGLLDIYVTNITDDYMKEGNFLWKNNGDLSFSDVAAETQTSDTGWGWAGKFFDYDNDGWLDLYVVNGWVSAGEPSYVPRIFEMIVEEHRKSGKLDLRDVRKWPPMGEASLSGYQRKRLFHNRQGQLFVDEAGRHGLDSLLDGRGVAVADFDSDGRLDLFVTNAGAEPRLYRNEAPRSGANWIQFSLRGRRSNRFAVGAQVRLRAGGRQWLSFVNGGNGFASQSSTRIHFGLGRYTAIEGVEVRWPCGLRQSLGPLPVNRSHVIREPERPSVLEQGEGG